MSDMIPPSYGHFRRDALGQPPFSTADLPPGWLFGIESTILYEIARIARGPVLEIGSWVGRSTCAMAMGIRDNPERPIFDVFDHGIASIREFQKYFDADARTHPDSEAILSVILHPGGAAALLKKNLIDRRLEDYINMIFLGDFRNASVSRQYSVCFCDATHDRAEIDKNVPPLLQMMQKDQFLIVFDDVWNAEDCQYVKAMCGADKAVCLGGGFSNGETDNGCKISIMAKGEYYSNLPWLS